MVPKKAFGNQPAFYHVVAFAGETPAMDRALQRVLVCEPILSHV
jgi:hypothetical protein